MIDLVSRATRFLLAGPPEPALWTISVRGRVVGSLVCEAGERRLAWFDGADRSSERRRLASLCPQTSFLACNRRLSNKLNWCEPLKRVASDAAEFRSCDW